MSGFDTSPHMNTGWGIIEHARREADRQNVPLPWEVKDGETGVALGSYMTDIAAAQHAKALRRDNPGHRYLICLSKLVHEIGDE